jgi:hypothetical protein
VALGFRAARCRPHRGELAATAYPSGDPCSTSCSLRSKRRWRHTRQPPEARGGGCSAADRRAITPVPQRGPTGTRASRSALDDCRCQGVSTARESHNRCARRRRRHRDPRRRGLRGRPRPCRFARDPRHTRSRRARQRSDATRREAPPGPPLARSADRSHAIAPTAPPTRPARAASSRGRRRNAAAPPRTVNA